MYLLPPLLITTVFGCIWSEPALFATPLLTTILHQELDSGELQSGRLSSFCFDLAKIFYVFLFVILEQLFQLFSSSYHQTPSSTAFSEPWSCLRHSNAIEGTTAWLQPAKWLYNHVQSIKNHKSSWKNKRGLDSSLPFRAEIHEDRTKYWTISSKSIVPSPFASCSLRVEVKAALKWC